MGKKTPHLLRVLQKTPEGEIGIFIGCDALLGQCPKEASRFVYCR